MNDTQSTILLVDDDPDILAFYEVHIADAGFTPLLANDGLDALELLDQHADRPPVAIISDVDMPRLDGYGLCRKLRDDPRFAKLPLLFVSTHTSLDEKLKGYAVGADDYIGKPVAADELLVKTRHFIDARIEHDSLSRQLSDSFNTTMQAMTYSSYLGQVLGFLQDATECEDYQRLAQRLFETSEALGLSCAIQFHLPSGLVGYRRDGAITPLESNIMEVSRTQSRFFDFGPRTIVNYTDFSLLVKNMPLDDAEKYGAIKDVLGNLCNAIEAVVKILMANDETRKKAATMSSVDDTLLGFERMLVSIQRETQEAIDDLAADLEDAFLTLGLTEAQEEKLRKIAHKCQLRTNQAFQKGMALNQSLSSVHSVLKSGAS